MSKKTNKITIVEALSFIGIIACGICLVLGQLGVGGTIIGTIANLALVVSAILASWNFVSRCSMVTKVIYYVCVILVIVLYII